MSEISAPELIHESEGLRIVRNVKNKFVVAWLNYRADPAKRSKAWEEEARAGLTDAQYRKEYLIDFTALFGEKVFPEIYENKSHIVVQPPYPEFGPNQTYWGGLDYGARNPSSVHFYTVWDGVIYSVWELFEPCQDIKAFVEKVKMFPFYGNVKYIAADPRVIDSRTTRNKWGNPCTMNELFVEAGLSKLIPGDNDEATWLAVMRQHWQNHDDPTFRIFSCCPNQIREFESATFSSASDKLLATQNFRETMTDKDNHSLDDCKYFMNSRPRLERKEVKFGRMVDKWKK